MKLFLILFLINISIYSINKQTNRSYIKINGKSTNLTESKKYIAIKLSKNNFSVKEELKNLSLPEIEKIKYIENGIFLIKFKNIFNKKLLKNKKTLLTLNSKDEWPLIINNRIIMKFKNNITENQQMEILKKYDLKLIYSFDYNKNIFVVSTKKATLKYAEKLYNLGFFEYSYPDYYIYHKKYFAPNDKYYPNQWHLNGNNIATNGVNAEAAWDINKGNSDIKIAILDDGVDTEHEDLDIADSYDFVKDEEDTGNVGEYYDVNNLTELCSDPTFENCVFGYYEDSSGERCEAPYTDCTFVLSHDAYHGTACAGVAAAKGNNNKGVTGLCMNCSVLAYQVMNSSGYAHADADLRAFDRAKLNADVVSCSWGYPADWGALSVINPAIIDIINDTVINGRNGKGLPVLFASGNEGDNFIDDSLPGLQNVISIGAVNYQDELTVYSNYGDNLFVVAPSNIGRGYSDDENMYAIWTTDIMGNDGYNKITDIELPCNNNEAGCQNYTSGFGGTSSATPLVSGLIALMLSENNNLSLEDIKNILKTNATRIPVIEEDWESIALNGLKCDENIRRNYDSNGHSVCMGYGKINALATMLAVRNFNSGNPCDNITCSNHGSCIAGNGLVECNCDDNYHSEGLNCIENQNNPCENINCSGHGLCIIDNNAAHCECDAGYTADGLICVESDRFPCEGINCSNHGRCIILDDEEACLCDEGYHDEKLTCISDITDKCDGIVCSNHGDCIIENDNAKCSCENGYYSDNNLHCVANEISKNKCENITCGNHGNCVEKNGIAVCNCDEGYYNDDLMCFKKLPDDNHDDKENNKSKADSSCSFVAEKGYNHYYILLFIVIMLFFKKILFKG